MVRRAMVLIATGVAAGIAVDRVAMELRKPAADQFPVLRQWINDTVNPWLMEHGIPGSAQAEIGDAGARGPHVRHDVLHPGPPDIRRRRGPDPGPARRRLAVGAQRPYGGHARLQFHETLYDLDRPELIAVAEAGLVPPQVAGWFDHMGWRYVRLHVAGPCPGSFSTHRRRWRRRRRAGDGPAARGDVRDPGGATADGGAASRVGQRELTEARRPSRRPRQSEAPAADARGLVRPSDLGAQWIGAAPSSSSNVMQSSTGHTYWHRRQPTQ